MNIQTEKLRLIYLPFLIIAIAVIGGYTLLNWLIIIKLQLFQVKDVFVNFIIPIVLSLIPVLIWLRLRIQLLKFSTTKIRDPHLLFQIIATIAIAIPTVIAQLFIDTATGELTELNNIHQIDKCEPTKFYKLKDYCIDKEHISIINKVEVIGKHNESLRLQVYVVCPILKYNISKKFLLFKEYDNTKPLLVIDGKPLPGIKPPFIPEANIDSVIEINALTAYKVFGERGKNGVILLFTNRFDKKKLNHSETTFASDTVKAWLGVLYEDKISNRSSAKEKEKLYNSFIEQSQRNFEYSDLSKFIYLKRQGNSYDLDEYKNAISKSHLVYSSNTVLIPVNEPFELRNGNKFAWIFGSFVIGAFIFLLMLLNTKHIVLKTNELNIRRYKKKNSELRDFLSIFIPKDGFFVSSIIIDLNVLLFLFMVFSGLGFISFKGSDLLVWGANYKPLTTASEWWRLLTSTFLHGGIMHLVANMYGLIFVGIFLEPRIGKIKFAVIYLLSGILASVTSLWWHDAIISVGASGAIFGLYGLFLALMLTKVYPNEFNKAFLISTLLFVGFNLLYGLTGGIDNAAHIGGLISGFVIGIMISPHLKNETEKIIIAEKYKNEDSFCYKK